MNGSIFDEIRAAAAAVTERAHFVRLDETQLAALSEELSQEPLSEFGSDPAHHRIGDAHTTLVFVLTLDAINFGSGWFPHLAKLPGRSGYLSIAEHWRRRFAASGAWSAAELAELRPQDCAQTLGQDMASAEVAELMELFARSLNDLGQRVATRYAGRFEGVVEAAGKSCAALVEALAAMPLYRDVASHAGGSVPFYKRAQITASDLHAAFEGSGFGSFADLDDLTIFADNLVPHVLRRKGVLVYASELAEAIDAGELIPAGSPEEVEIRAVGLHAVERCLARMRDRGVAATAREIDAVLWGWGQRPEFKAHPRHRTRSTFY